MRVAELMQPNVRSISADDTILDAVTTMADSRISGLPVVDSAGRILGVVTATDILQAESEQGDSKARRQLFEQTPVRDLMTPTPHLIAPDDDIREAAKHMLYVDVRRLFVAEKGRLVGVISQTDIAHAVATGRI